MQGILVPASPQGEDVTAGFEWYDSGIGFALGLIGLLVIQHRIRRLLSCGRRAFRSWRDIQRRDLERLRQFNERQLGLLIAIAAQPKDKPFRDLMTLCDGNGERIAQALTEDLPNLEHYGFLRRHKVEGGSFYYSALADSGRLAQAELLRREQAWEEPGTRLGPRSRASGLAERAA